MLYLTAFSSVQIVGLSHLNRFEECLVIRLRIRGGRVGSSKNVSLSFFFFFLNHHSFILNVFESYFGAYFLCRHTTMGTARLANVPDPLPGSVTPPDPGVLHSFKCSTYIPVKTRFIPIYCYLVRCLEKQYTPFFFPNEWINSPFWRAGCHPSWPVYSINWRWSIVHLLLL